MNKKPDSLEKGDWIVHSYYGIGQIKCIETKLIEQKKTRYFKVKGKNSTFFVPVSNVINERIRPISTDYKLRKAKKAFRSPPQPLPKNHTERKRLLQQLSSDRSLENIAALLRDLICRKEIEGLNDYEENILQLFETLFIKEWAIIKEITEDEVRIQYNKIVMEEILENL